MKGYLFAEIEITDPETYKQYRPLAAAAIAAFGGRFLIRGGDPEVMEGGRNPKRTVLVEFESIERAREFYHSAQYQAAASVRKRASNGHVYLMTGTELPA
jgi:uncharacterized protein (DUF1330 family)